MIYKGWAIRDDYSLVFEKKLGIKTRQILKIIRYASSRGENKEGNTQGMCFLGKK